MNVDPAVREHLQQAKDAAVKAVQTAADDLGERLVSSEVRGHVRSAARNILQAAIAAIDARDAKAAAKKATATEARAAEVAAALPTTPNIIA